ncbi:hypothetical protein Rhsp01_64030 [Rhizobium sp. NBRC 114257]|uniref:Uncharacterized protein n=1 Tax=Rhizobium dioscoreae TaxID=2653122 RepID=A0ABQ0ZE76_9HYPH|nr:MULTISPECIES: HAD-IA family hydrolase [Rhizobium]GES53774.1 hypothetical protein RsS93_63880 [Rhizobium dioscoreae]GLU85227.1 hypothetical protein Rhsp01_64030 [Rhizobium sp. NBRC 114257]
MNDKIQAGGNMLDTDVLSHLIASAQNADIISFDFFDTLFLRTVIDPEDVFDLVGQRAGIEGFREIRRKAQSDAFAQMHSDGRKEITMRGIYEKFSHDDVNSDEIMSLEYEMELRVALPNTEVVAAFEEFISSGKKVIITSDMYLPKSYFADVLRAFEIPAVDIFVSSEVNCTKRDTGELFSYIARETGVPPGRILHIGDNPISDVDRAAEKGLQVFHYRNDRVPPVLPTVKSTEYSVARGLSKKHPEDIHSGTYQALGYHYAGPAAIAFYEWLKKEVVADGVSHVLLMARDGYIVDQIRQFDPNPIDTSFTYFKGSRTVFTLASINENNFLTFLPFLTSGAFGLTPAELFTRINVPAPEQKLLDDLGLGGNVTITADILPRIHDLLIALQWHIIRTCQQNSRGVFSTLVNIGIRPNDKVGIVDVGWNGTTQSAFETAIADCFPLDVKGYYLALTESEECLARQKKSCMKAMFAGPDYLSSDIKAMYNNRVVVEFLFSAPHHSIISLQVSETGDVLSMADSRRHGDSHLLLAVEQVIDGARKFASDFYSTMSDMKLPFNPKSLLAPLHSLILDDHWKKDVLFEHITDFDDWALARKKPRKLTHY